MKETTRYINKRKSEREREREGKREKEGGKERESFLLQCSLLQ